MEIDAQHRAFTADVLFALNEAAVTPSGHGSYGVLIVVADPTLQRPPIGCALTYDYHAKCWHLKETVGFEAVSHSGFDA